MRANVLLKVVLLFGLLLTFGVCLLLIGGVVGERKSYRDQVIAEVARSTAGEQVLLGPLLVVPYSRPAPTIASGGARAEAPARVRDELVLLPESLSIVSKVRVEERHRGIHKAQVFRSTNRLRAVFQVPPHLGLEGSTTIAGEGPAWLAFGVSDSRGLHRPPVVHWEGAVLDVQPGSRLSWSPQGFSSDVGALVAPNGRRIEVDIDLDLIGTNQMSFVPVGASTRAEMAADWPDPSFVGDFLPDTRTIDAHGFRAAWELSRFATGVSSEIELLHQGPTSGRGGHSAEREPSDFGVRFIEQVDIYQKSERAVKYGMLFVLLTFVAIFIFEVLRRMDVHPMQYLLAGAGVAVFFLLLLSLSEHVPFVLAYLVASGACIGLLTMYVANVFSSRARGLSFGVMLALLYALLYVILESTDYALLLGTLLLFGVLATVMVLTRRVDWYKVGEKPPAA